MAEGTSCCAVPWSHWARVDALFNVPDPRGRVDWRDGGDRSRLGLAVEAGRCRCPGCDSVVYRSGV